MDEYFGEFGKQVNYAKNYAGNYKEQFKALTFLQYLLLSSRGLCFWFAYLVGLRAGLLKKL